jgi:hypothetical protein
MRRTQLYLEEQLWSRLHLLARQSGTSLSELVRQAVREKYARSSVDRQKALRAAAGLWADRADLPAAETYVRGLRTGVRLKRITR